MATAKKDNKGVWPIVKPFLVGGSAGMFATCCIQPIDMMKTRIQIAGEGTKQGKGFFEIGRAFVKEEGFFALYRGLSAGLLRQATYTTARMGLYRTISDALTEPGKPLPFLKKCFGGMFAGGLASIFGVPADLVLIRMQADKTLPVEQRRNYKGLFDALSRIVREEGVLSLWKGCQPTIVRAVFLNLGMFAPYDQAKEELSKLGLEGRNANLAASAVSGFFASALSLPFDFIKTRIQKQKPDATGALPYKNSLDCAKKVFMSEGPLSFYRGFPTFYVRIAPHVMITLLVTDEITRLLKSYGL
eukprot:TRINITY_DN561_c0_g2_i1.p1 TRINITY_DN561_c0_g2~~TRINITY_DN561_c0_g2_i1.p1  ORF type:complete len:302 (-),score=130.20 TRINITY_DN561_c0_g2_i1:145-1050(-)